jgi:hypothetical protein
MGGSDVAGRSRRGISRDPPDPLIWILAGNVARDSSIALEYIRFFVAGVRW